MRAQDRSIACLNIIWPHKLRCQCHATIFHATLCQAGVCGGRKIHPRHHRILNHLHYEGTSKVAPVPKPPRGLQGGAIAASSGCSSRTVVVVVMTREIVPHVDILWNPMEISRYMAGTSGMLLHGVHDPRMDRFIGLAYSMNRQKKYANKSVYDHRRCSSSQSNHLSI